MRDIAEDSGDHGENQGVGFSRRGGSGVVYEVQDIVGSGQDAFAVGIGTTILESVRKLRSS